MEMTYGNHICSDLLFFFSAILSMQKNMARLQKQTIKENQQIISSPAINKKRKNVF